MSAVVLDASALLALLRGEAGAKKVEGAMLTPLPITLVDADAEQCWEAGRLRGLTVEAGLSLGDRSCLALAKREKLPAWTADKR